MQGGSEGEVRIRESVVWVREGRVTKSTLQLCLIEGMQGCSKGQGQSAKL